MHSLHQNVFNPADQLSKRHLGASICSSPVAEYNNRYGQCDKM